MHRGLTAGPINRADNAGVAALVKSWASQSLQQHHDFQRLPLPSLALHVTSCVAVICLKLGVDQKYPANCRNGAFDP